MKADCPKHGFYELHAGCNYCPPPDATRLWDAINNRGGDRRTWLDLLHKEVTFDSDLVERLATIVMGVGCRYSEDIVEPLKGSSDDISISLRSSDFGTSFNARCSSETLYVTRKTLVLQLVTHDASVRGKRVLK